LQLSEVVDQFKAKRSIGKASD